MHGSRPRYQTALTRRMPRRLEWVGLEG